MQKENQNTSWIFHYLDHAESHWCTKTIKLTKQKRNASPSLPQPRGVALGDDLHPLQALHVGVDQIVHHSDVISSWLKVDSDGYGMKTASLQCLSNARTGIIMEKNRGLFPTLFKITKKSSILNAWTITCNLKQYCLWESCKGVHVWFYRSLGDHPLHKLFNSYLSLTLTFKQTHDGVGTDIASTTADQNVPIASRGQRRCDSSGCARCLLIRRNHGTRWKERLNVPKNVPCSSSTK